MSSHSSRVVSVIIVTHNSSDIALDCIQRALRADSVLEVIVVDNASDELSRVQLQQLASLEPALILLENDKNQGFASAVNQGLSKAKGAWLLCLNPDCLLEITTLANMLEMARAYPDAGMLGCLIRNSDGTEQAGCRRDEPTPWRSLMRVSGLWRWQAKHQRYRDFNRHQEALPTEPIAVDAISGAFMLVHRVAVNAVGAMDEGYFLHCEDLDWCRRFRDQGYTILFVPQICVVHEKGTSSKNKLVRVEWHKHHGMVRYFRKFYRHQYPRLLTWLVIAAVWVRFGLLAVRAVVLRKHM